MDITIGRFIKEICNADVAAARKSLIQLIQSKDEDLLIIAIRELLADHRLIPGSKMAYMVSSTLYVAKPNRSILNFVSQKLEDSSLSGSAWLDEYLAANAGFDIEEWPTEWDKLEDVIKIREMLPASNYSTAVEERCSPAPVTI